MAVPSANNPQPEVYYPSCIVNLVIRYDTAFTLTKSGALALGVGDPASRRNAVDTLVQASFGADPFARGEFNAQSSGIPLFTDPISKDGNSFSFNQIPKSASIELPAYRQAGKFSLTFDYKDLPIDPRLVRSIGVSIYMDTVSAGDFAKGITSANQPDRAKAILTPSRQNLVLKGVVDNWSVRHSNNGSEVSMEGRDQRAILMDSKLNPELLKTLNLKQPIDAVVRDIIKTHPFLQGVKVSAGVPIYTDETTPLYWSDWPGGIVPSPTVDNNETSPLNILKPATKKSRVNRGADGKSAKASPKATPDVVSYWDLIVNYCALVGAVPYFVDADTIRIRPTRTLFDQINPTGVTTGGNSNSTLQRPTSRRGGAFQRGETSRTVGGETLVIRRLVFGQNAEEVTYERKYSGIRAQTVQVVSVNTSSTSKGAQTLLIAEYPTEDEFIRGTAAMYGAVSRDLAKAVVNSESPSGQAGTKDKIIIYKAGISDIEVLRSLAYDIYEELMRGEQGGSIKTRSLASFGGNNSDPDLLYLRPGDAVELQTDSRALSNRAPLVSTLNAQAQGLNDGELLTQLTEKLVDPNHARAVIASLKKYVAELQDVYRVSNVKFDWNIASGVTVAFDFQNYIIPRQQVNDLPLPGQGRSSGVGTPSPTLGVNVSGNPPTTGNA